MKNLGQCAGHCLAQRARMEGSLILRSKQGTASTTSRAGEHDLKAVGGC